MSQEEKGGSLRSPAVAGTFYPGEKKALERALQNLFKPPAEKPEGNIVGLVCPHAGYIYSGRTAARAYSLLQGSTRRSVVVIGPNHTGLGAPVSVYPEGEWETPLGRVPVDSEKAERLGSLFWKDELAHLHEHSVEVQIPFLQHTLKEFRLVAVCMMDQRIGTARRLGQALHEILDPEKDLVVASTDFSHYVPQNVAEENDRMAIKAIEEGDQEGLYSLVRRGLSMCGYGPVCALMEYVRLLKGRIRNIEYSTSAETNGDYYNVVGYASFYAEVE